MAKILVNRLNDAIRRVQQQREMKLRLSTLGADAVVMSAAEFGALIKRDAALWGGVVRKAGIKPD